MEACLGIYLGERIIKYAKLIRDEKSRRISLNSCGTKYIVGNKESAIAEIIEQTGSKEDKLVVNLSGYNRITTEVPSVNRVCYELTKKPVATIEFE